MLYIGTAGFSYGDWKGVFYPEDLKPQEFLAYYAERFPCVELDFTYYRQPSPKTMQAMARNVPPSFRFTVKAHRTLTHEIPPADQLVQETSTFLRGIEPLIEASKLGCILFQFPYSFRYNPENLDYVLSVRDRLSSLPVVVEFRNSGWARNGVYQALTQADLGFCCVDEPDLRGLFPRISVVTSSIAYVRFHGRNAEKWFNHVEAWERYDYLYSDEELRWWIPKIQDMARQAEDTYVLFNNCHRGQAAVNARRLQELLMEAPLT